MTGDDPCSSESAAIRSPGRRRRCAGLGLAIGLFAIALALSGTILASAPLIERIASPAR
jgi:hypothetical protein